MTCSVLSSWNSTAKGVKPFNGSLLEAEMMQRVKDRNRDVGICDASQKLIASICAVGLGREGGRVAYPGGKKTEWALPEGAQEETKKCTNDVELSVLGLNHRTK